MFKGSYFSYDDDDNKMEYKYTILPHSNGELIFPLKT